MVIKIISKNYQGNRVGLVSWSYEFQATSYQEKSVKKEVTKEIILYQDKATAG